MATLIRGCLAMAFYPFEEDENHKGTGHLHEKIRHAAFAVPQRPTIPFFVCHAPLLVSSTRVYDNYTKQRTDRQFVLFYGWLSIELILASVPALVNCSRWALKQTKNKLHRQLRVN